MIFQVFGDWLNQVTTKNRIFFSTKPNPLRGIREKKGTFINKPWSKISCIGWNKQPKFWPSRTSRKNFFFLQNPYTFSKKKISSQILRFLTNFEARYIQLEDWFWKQRSIALLKIVSRFRIFYQKFVCMMLFWLLCFGVKNVLKFQHFCSSGAQTKADVTKCGYVLESSRNWYINLTESMHLSGNIACQSWRIIAKSPPSKTTTCVIFFNLMDHR